MVSRLILDQHVKRCNSQDNEIDQNNALGLFGSEQGQAGKAYRDEIVEIRNDK